MQEENLKTCSKCQETKALSQFHKWSASSDGHKPRCKACRNNIQRAYSKIYYESKRNDYKFKEKQRQYSKTYYEAHKDNIEWNHKFREANKKALKKYRENNVEKNRNSTRVSIEKAHNKYPEKVLARKQLRNAIRRGEIRRQPCEVCGQSEKIHGHHEDYTKPLDVKWLCPDHHALRHRNLYKNLPYQEFLEIAWR